jgi:hypothetical protein
MTKTRETSLNEQISLREQIGQSERELSEMETEQAGLPAKIQQASYDGDAAAMIAARQRARELPLYLHGMKVRLARLRLTAAEMLLVDFDVEMRRTSAAILPVRERFDEARAALEAVTALAQGAQSERYDVLMRIGDYKQQLNALLGEASANAA